MPTKKLKGAVKPPARGNPNSTAKKVAASKSKQAKRKRGLQVAANVTRPANRQLKLTRIPKAGKAKAQPNPQPNPVTIKVLGVAKVANTQGATMYLYVTRYNASLGAYYLYKPAQANNPAYSVTVYLGGGTQAVQSTWALVAVKWFNKPHKLTIK